MYLPLAYINRYSLLTELYCDEEHLNCVNAPYPVPFLSFEKLR